MSAIRLSLIGTERELTALQDGEDPVPEHLAGFVEMVTLSPERDLRQAVEAAQGSHVALFRREAIAVDGLLQAAALATRSGVDLVRCIGLLRSAASTGILGLDALLGADFSTSLLSAHPEHLLDARLENMVVSRKLLAETLARDETPAGTRIPPALGSRLLLATRAVARAPFVVGSSPCREQLDDDDLHARAMNICREADALGELHGLFARLGLGLRYAALRHMVPAEAPELSPAQRLLVVGAMPGCVVKQAVAAGKDAQRYVATAALRHLLAQGSGMGEFWLASANDWITDDDLAAEWRASPADALPLLLARRGQPEAARRLLTGEVDKALLASLDTDHLQAVAAATLAERVAAASGPARMEALDRRSQDALRRADNAAFRAATLRNARKRSEEAAAEAEARARAANTRVRELKEKLASEKEAYQHAAHRGKKEAARLNEALAEATQRAAKLLARAQRAEQAAQKAEEQLAAVKERVERLALERATLQNEREALARQGQQLSRELARVRAARKEAEARYQALFDRQLRERLARAWRRVRGAADPAPPAPEQPRTGSD